MNQDSTFNIFHINKSFDKKRYKEDLPQLYCIWSCIFSFCKINIHCSHKFEERLQISVFNSARFVTTQEVTRSCTMSLHYSLLQFVFLAILQPAFGGIQYCLQEFTMVFISQSLSFYHFTTDRKVARQHFVNYCLRTH